MSGFRDYLNEAKGPLGDIESKWQDLNDSISDVLGLMEDLADDTKDKNLQKSVINAEAALEKMKGPYNIIKRIVQRSKI